MVHPVSFCKEFKRGKREHNGKIFMACFIRRFFIRTCCPGNLGYTRALKGRYENNFCTEVYKVSR